MEKFRKTERTKGGEQGPEEGILKEILNRVRIVRGMDKADTMRFELYLMDIMRAAKNGGDKQDEELLAEVKKGDSYANLNTVMDVPDSTTLALIIEIREKLFLRE